MRLSILIVDDDPQVLDLFTKILKKDKYDITAVPSGGEAMQVLRERPVDLLILDLSMPEPDGFAILQKLHAVRPGLRILVISGYLQGQLLPAAEVFGATGTLSKTDAPKLLRKTVKDLLRRSG